MSEFNHVSEFAQYDWASDDQGLLDCIDRCDGCGCLDGPNGEGEFESFKDRTGKFVVLCGGCFAEWQEGTTTLSEVIQGHLDSGEILPPP